MQQKIGIPSLAAWLRFWQVGVFFLLLPLVALRPAWLYQSSQNLTLVFWAVMAALLVSEVFYLYSALPKGQDFLAIPFVVAQLCHSCLFDSYTSLPVALAVLGISVPLRLYEAVIFYRKRKSGEINHCRLFAASISMELLMLIKAGNILYRSSI